MESPLITTTLGGKDCQKGTSTAACWCVTVISAWGGEFKARLGYIELLFKKKKVYTVMII